MDHSRRAPKHTPIPIFQDLIPDIPPLLPGPHRRILPPDPQHRGGSVRLQLRVVEVSERLERLGEGGGVDVSLCVFG